MQRRDQLEHLISDLKLTKPIAEIGVAEGNFSEKLVTWGVPKVYLVDRWESHPETYGDSANEQEWHNGNYDKVVSRLEGYKDRYNILKGDSVAVAKNIPDESLSMVYLDADHTYEGVVKDLAAWYPKVEYGGIIAGHDYLNLDYGVNRAVTEFVGDKFHVVVIPENEPNNASFYFIKNHKPMPVTCTFSGRLGNCFYNIAMMVAYCKKYGLQYYVPDVAIACANRVPTITIPSTGSKPNNPIIYREPNMVQGNPYYHDIPRMDNVCFDGYYQSFKYFNWCRQDILDAFNLLYQPEDITAIHVRRGDNKQADHFFEHEGKQYSLFPILPTVYYHKAVEYMQQRGLNHFKIYTEPHPGDMEWCKEEFTSDNYPEATFEFREPGTELEDWISMSNCKNIITARSTYSLTAAWMNQNPDKIVLVPQENMWWKGQNKDLLADSGFTQIFFPQDYNPHMRKYVYDYKGISFGLIIQNYWKDIYRGKDKEPLYADYQKMLDTVQKVDKNRYILDIGVNHGIFAVPCSLLGYKVLGFEPVEVNYNSVELSAIENKLTNFDIYNYALSDKDENVEIYIPECSDNASLSKEASIANMVGKEYRAETIKCINFDNWIQDNEKYRDIGLIKIDVQGAEYKVITGMKEFLQNAHDLTIICEYEHHLNTMGHSFQELDELIVSCGFQDKGRITPNDKIFYKA